MWTFAKRCSKDILRDPLNLVFGLGFPLVLLLLLSSIQANIPVNLFEIDTLTPGITVFGLSVNSLELTLIHLAVKLLGENIQRPETGIVPRMRIILTWVT
jgi:hypothetical protein